MSASTERSTREGVARPRRRLWLIAGAVAGLGIAGFSAIQATAQWGGPHGGPGGGWGPRAWDRGYGPPEAGDGFHRGRRFARFCNEDTARWHPVGRLFVKTDLRLSPEQSAQFDRLADAVLPGLEEVKREACNNFVARAGSAPEKIQHLAEVLRKAADTAERAVEPSRSFYASLNEEQRTRVDAALERGRRMVPPPPR